MPSNENFKFSHIESENNKRALFPLEFDILHKKKQLIREAKLSRFKHSFYWKNISNKYFHLFLKQDIVAFNCILVFAILFETLSLKPSVFFKIKIENILTGRREGGSAQIRTERKFSKFFHRPFPTEIFFVQKFKEFKQSSNLFKQTN